jgi:hypothetical protein
MILLLTCLLLFAFILAQHMLRHFLSHFGALTHLDFHAPTTAQNHVKVYIYLIILTRWTCWAPLETALSTRTMSLSAAPWHLFHQSIWIFLQELFEKTAWNDFFRPAEIHTYLQVTMSCVFASLLALNGTIYGSMAFNMDTLIPGSGTTLGIYQGASKMIWGLYCIIESYPACGYNVFGHEACWFLAKHGLLVTIQFVYTLFMLIYSFSFQIYPSTPIPLSSFIHSHDTAPADSPWLPTRPTSRESYDILRLQGLTPLDYLYTFSRTTLISILFLH